MASKKILDANYIMEKETVHTVTILNFSIYNTGYCDILYLLEEYAKNCLIVKIYPNGDCSLNEGHVCFEILNIPQNINFKCTVSIVDHEGNSSFPKTFINETSQTTVRPERFIDRCNLLKNNLEYLPDDKLTIQFEMIYMMSSEEGLIIEKPSQNAHKIKVKFMDDEAENYNFEIETKDGKIESLVLKKGTSFMSNPLCKKSPVFAKMLSTAMKENESNKLIITDMDHNTLKNFLNFVYNNSFMFENVQDIVDLYEAADKYQVLDLKYQCARDISCNLTSENVCNALLLADVHNDKALKYVCILYLRECLDEVFKTDSWESLVENYPELADEAINLDMTEIKEKLKDQLLTSEIMYSEEALQFYI
ncbi:TD and POZ domain-containing protein 4, partial [Stegodyphus mimosarum]